MGQQNYCSIPRRKGSRRSKRAKNKKEVIRKRKSRNKKKKQEPKLGLDANTKTQLADPTQTQPKTLLFFFVNARCLLLDVRPTMLCQVFQQTERCIASVEIAFVGLLLDVGSTMPR